MLGETLMTLAGAGLLQGSLCAQWSERQGWRPWPWVRSPVATHTFFLSVCFCADLPPVAYNQFLPPVVDTKRKCMNLEGVMSQSACANLTLCQLHYVYLREYMVQIDRIRSTGGFCCCNQRSARLYSRLHSTNSSIRHNTVPTTI